MAKKKEDTKDSKFRTDDALPQDGVSLYVITGTDEFLVRKHARTLVDALCPAGEQALGLEIVDGETDTVDDAIKACSVCLEALQTMGFFGGRKVVWLRNATFLGHDAIQSKSEQLKPVMEALTSCIKRGLPDGTILIISAARMDGRTAFFKACQQGGVLYQYAAPDPAARGSDESVATKIADVWAGLGLSPESHDVVQMFQDRVGFDTRQILQESEKLRTYLGAGQSHVKREDVLAIVSHSRESIGWDLADHVGYRRLSAALRTFRQLLFQKESPVGMIIQIEQRFRDMLSARECERRKWLRLEGNERYQKAVWSLDGEGEALMSRFTKGLQTMHSYRVMLLLRQARNYSLRELMYAVEESTRTHETMVSAGSMPHELLVESFLIQTLAKPEGNV
jgi:DNA polymerase III subunit delta